MGSRFNALLSHQGPIKNVSHAHRQCAPVPTERDTYDLYGNVLSWGLGDPPADWDPSATPESRLTTADLEVNLKFVGAKINHMNALVELANALRPFTSYVSNQVTQLTIELTDLTSVWWALSTELNRRLN